MGPFIELLQTETRASCLLDEKYNLVRDLTVRNSVRPPFRCSNVEHSTIIPIRMASLFRSRQQRNDERRLTVHYNSSYSKWEIRKVLLAEFSEKIEKATVVNLEDIPVPMAINVPPISHLLMDAMDDFSDNDLGDDPVI
uniref:Uncharacterized protein n=1 Tax=Vespula pensylvanica TaxID=30213 RepID=A0A834JTF5_VESPE|nr:hypothetical protein H0235_017043 [Vespula pensylvanica]